MKHLGLFAAGVLFGTAGLKILSSKDAKKVYGIVKPAEKDDDDGKRKKGGNHIFDLRKIGIDYEGKEAALFVETNGLIGKVVEAVKARWDANEQLLIDKTFGGRASRYA